jgi:N-formylglutamate deformylase
MKEAVILHIPHSALAVPRDILPQFTCPPQILAENIRALTDWKTDELFCVPGFANRLVFPVSRLVCDPERFRADRDECMAARGMGAVYTHDAWRRRIRTATAAQREEILERYYDPHHRRLEQMAGRILAQYGSCMVIDCHSFPQAPLPYEPVQDVPRPDFCLGTDPEHTPPQLIAAIADYLETRGCTAALNTPFAGTLLPLALLGSPGLHGIMIEVNRGLYMEPERLQKNAGWDRARETVAGVLAIAAQMV